jgi:FkbM family methyltransferase
MGSLLAKKLRTGLRVLFGRGPAAVWLILVDKVRQTSRKMPGGLVRLEGCVFRSNPELMQWLLNGEYEGPERFAAKRYVRRDIPVVEFGGSLGVVSCLLNRRLKNPANHVVVEANPQILPTLIENRDRNHCKFEILHGAAGGVGKTVRIYIGESVLASSAITTSPESVEVAAFTLAEILQSRGFGRCALMCDIEGSELEIIRAEMDTLRSRVEVFVVEFHPDINGLKPVEEARLLLKDHGFAEAWHQKDVFVYLNSGLANLA